MKNLIIIAICFFGFSYSVNAEIFSSDRSYRNYFFETMEACKKDQEEKGTWFNCFQKIELRKDGNASVMMSDIMNFATYSFDHKTRIITIKMIDQFEISGEIKLFLSYNLRNLIDPQNLTVWEWNEE